MIPPPKCSTAWNGVNNTWGNNQEKVLNTPLGSLITYRTHQKHGWAINSWIRSRITTLRLKWSWRSEIMFQWDFPTSKIKVTDTHHSLKLGDSFAKVPDYTQTSKSRHLYIPASEAFTFSGALDQLAKICLSPKHIRGGKQITRLDTNSVKMWGDLTDELT